MTHGADSRSPALERRDLLKLLGASLAAAGLAGCDGEADERILPYVRQPEWVVPGNPLTYATALDRGGFALGVLVESHTGRPTKVEGNPDHPASLGATDAIAQAEILGLYDPDRARTVTYRGQVATWPQFTAAAIELTTRLADARGRGLRLLTGAVTSPSLQARIGRLLAAYPEARWHVHEPVDQSAVVDGARLALGRPLSPVYALDRADVIVSLDSDFLAVPPGRLRYARDFSRRRRVRGQPAGSASMNRLYVLESTTTITGAAADHRWPVAARSLETAARALARRLGVAPDGPAGGAGVDEAVLDMIAADLEAHAGRCVVIPGESQTAAVAALAHAMNWKLGNVGTTVEFIEPPTRLPPGPASDAQRTGLPIAALAEDMMRGAVEALVILGTNPAYDAPADVPFAEALERVPARLYWGAYEDETAARCHWHVPAAHPFESWGDGRAFDGTASIVQPLIRPLYGGRTAHAVLAALMREPERDGYDIVRSFWAGRREGRDFEAFWRAALQAGVVPDTRARPETVSLAADFAARVGPRREIRAEGLEVRFRPDPMIWDGRHANNVWLQEMPKPLTKLTWGNAVLVAPSLARAHGLANGDEVELSVGERSVRGPVWTAPGMPHGTATIDLGYGRARAGEVGTGIGFSAYRLRTADAPWFAQGGRLSKTGRTVAMATTQHHHRMEGRHLVRPAALDAYRRNPNVVHDMAPGEPPRHSLYEPYPYPRHAWAMVIDPTVCIGCEACVAACQAENNIPTVGKDEVLRGHEMHWLRVDSYYAGGLDNPATYFQPVPCMHCENAPCEIVCPVNATVHTAGGLNAQVYNRCIGTRYCSQNCPYKVRRFNWLNYAFDGQSEAFAPQKNPDVSVRSRGVMEKCTYCIQRISAARIEAERERRAIRDGEVRTACQQACPTEAIVFGDLDDPSSAVGALKASPLNYALLAELNTRPRTTYLGLLRNPHPGLEARQSHSLVSTESDPQ